MIIYCSKDILSVEGTSPGDNLAMAFYALDTAPLLKSNRQLFSLASF